MDSTIELTIGLMALVLATLGFLLAAPALEVIGLVVAGVSFGMALMRRLVAG